MQPVQRALPLGQFRKRQLVIKKPLHQRMLDRTGHCLVDGDVHMAPTTVRARCEHSRQAALHRHEARVVERLPSPEIQGTLR